MSHTTFSSLGVPAVLSEVLATRGITEPTPIQAATLPDSLAGRDVLGRGRTGSGKTYAFLLPLVDRLARSARPRRPKQPRALVLAPTRELATQIEEALAPLAAPLGLTSRTVFGGVGQQPQVNALRSGVDVVIACPGRLEDLLRQGHARLDAIEVTVIDEADHMSDLGFLPAVRRLLDLTPEKGQRMLFSATLDGAVDVLVRAYLNRPVTHQADSATAPPPAMTHHVLHVSTEGHLPVLVDLAAAPGRSVIFTRTKHRAKRLAKQLNASGVPAVELHGNLSQGARTRTMDAFHSGRARTLVATDIAARGIHVDDVALVIHADPPAEAKAYLHRSGRTARAGAAGTVVTLMTDSQVGEVRDLTRKAGVRATTTRVTPTHPLLRELAPGERELPGGLTLVVPPQRDADRPAREQSRGAGQPRGGQPRGGQPRSGQSRGGQSSSGQSRGGAQSRAGQSRGGAQQARGARPAAAAAPQTGAARRTGGAAAFSAGSSGGARRGR